MKQESLLEDMNSPYLTPDRVRLTIQATSIYQQLLRLGGVMLQILHQFMYSLSANKQEVSNDNLLEVSVLQIWRQKIILFLYVLVGGPLHQLGVDVLLPVTHSGKRYVICFVDYLTKWVEAFPMPEQRADARLLNMLFVDMVCLNNCYLKEELSSYQS